MPDIALILPILVCRLLGKPAMNADPKSDYLRLKLPCIDLGKIGEIESGNTQILLKFAKNEPNKLLPYFHGFPWFGKVSFTGNVYPNIMQIKNKKF